MNGRHASLPRAFDLTRLGYFLDFALVPPIAGALVWAALGVGTGAVSAWIVLGAALWTLAEYLIHRLAFHAFPWLEAMHQVHHADPKGFVGIASWGTLPGFAGALATAAVVLGLGPACALTAGFMAGYLFYCIIHVRMHHRPREQLYRYERFMRDRHAAHHRGGRGNFGVTSPIWDIVFRSYHPIG